LVSRFQGADLKTSPLRKFPETFFQRLFSGGSVVATKLTHETNQCNPNPVYLIAAYPFVEKSGFLKDPGADPVRFNRYPKLWFRFY
jgi:hypothetical protein